MKNPTMAIAVTITAIAGKIPHKTRIVITKTQPSKIFEI